MLDVLSIREHFPALKQKHNGMPIIFFDSPGGSQLPKPVIDKMAAYLKHGNANLGGLYKTSDDTFEQMERTRRAIQLFLNAKSKNEIHFGQNMTSLTFSFSRSLANTWQNNDEVIVTDLDHEANISPWELAAKEKDVLLKTWHFNADTYNLETEDLEKLLTPKTKLLAITAASNICGSMPKLKEIIEIAHKNNTQVYVDATHFAAHEIIDVKDLDCDYLVCSAYKFCGPHLGIFYGKLELMQKLKPYKINPATRENPYCWETGTQNFEAIAALEETIYYKMRLLGNKEISRENLLQSLNAIKHYELMLKQYFIAQLEGLDGIQIHGVTNAENAKKRTSTFALTSTKESVKKLTQALVDEGFCIGSGHFYVPKFIKRLGLDLDAGILRIGFSYYNTIDELEHLFETLTRLLDCKTYFHAKAV